MDAIRRMLYAEFYNLELWTSGNDIANEGDFVWQNDGTPIDVGDRDMWAHPEPNNYGGNEDCVIVVIRNGGSSLKLNDNSCNRHYWFACEY